MAENKCPECGETFPGAAALEWHRTSVHSATDLNTSFAKPQRSGSVKRFSVCLGIGVAPVLALSVIAFTQLDPYSTYSLWGFLAILVEWACVAALLIAAVWFLVVHQKAKGWGALTAFFLGLVWTFGVTLAGV